MGQNLGQPSFPPSLSSPSLSFPSLLAPSFPLPRRLPPYPQSPPVDPNPSTSCDRSSYSFDPSALSICNLHTCSAFGTRLHPSVRPSDRSSAPSASFSTRRGGREIESRLDGRSVRSLWLWFVVHLSFSWITEPQAGDGAFPSPPLLGTSKLSTIPYGTCHLHFLSCLPYSLDAIYTYPPYLLHSKLVRSLFSVIV